MHSRKPPSNTTSLIVITRSKSTKPPPPPPPHPLSLPPWHHNHDVAETIPPLSTHERLSGSSVSGYVPPPPPPTSQVHFAGGEKSIGPREVNSCRCISYYLHLQEVAAWEERGRSGVEGGWWWWWWCCHSIFFTLPVVMSKRSLVMVLSQHFLYLNPPVVLSVRRLAVVVLS